MALFNCPECGKEISDKAVSCPNCGYVLHVKSENDGSSTSPSTDLGPVEGEPVNGTITMVVGWAMLLIGAFLAFYILPLGLICLGASVIIIIWGGSKSNGTQKAVCPYCGYQTQINAKADGLHCTYCGKRSIRKGDKLYTVK